MVVGKAVNVDCSGDLTIVFFHSVFQTSAGFFLSKKDCNFLLGMTIFCFSCDEILSLGCIRIDLRVLAPLKINWILEVILLHIYTLIICSYHIQDATA